MTSLAELTQTLIRSTKVLLVLDVVESVRLMEADENGFVHRWQQLRERTKQLLLEHDGRMVKSLGDGLMLEFSHVTGCIKTAFALRDFCAAGNTALRLENQLHLRMGIHVASFVADEQDIYGTDVNLTARITTLAGPGEIVVSADIRDQLAVGLDVDAEDLGDCHLKHVEKTVRAYRIGPPGHAPVIQPGNTVPLDLRPTIAVIPFSSQGMDAHHALIGEAVADELIAALSRTAELHVISRLSTTVFSNRPKDSGALEDIRQHLGATYVLSGRCRVMGAQLTLFVELAEAAGGRIVWADNLKSTVSGLFAADDDLLSRIVGTVSSAVMRRELNRAENHALPTLDGYTLLMGAVAMMHRTDYHDFDRARLMLEHLIERSRRHPVPHAWLAKWHVLKVQQGWSPNIEAEARLALDSTQRALDSEPNNAMALTVEGFVQTNLRGDLDTGLKRYQHALDQNPNESIAWLLKGMLHAFKGESEGADALAASKQALILSPLDPIKYFYDSLAASASVTAGDYQRAIELAKRSLKANRTHTSTFRALAIAQALNGDLVGARATVADLLSLDSNFTLKKFMDRYPGRLHAPEFARKLADALQAAGVPIS
jgi:adenylate cyclase